MKPIEYGQIALLIFWIAIRSLNAQNGTLAAGSDAQGVNGAVAWSVGQVTYSNNTWLGASESQGVQQPYELYITASSQNSSFDFKLKLYPNPTKDFVILQLQDFKNENLSYQLFDVSGKLLISSEIVGTKTNIALNQYISSTYLLNVISNKQIVKSFKIIKN